MNSLARYLISKDERWSGSAQIRRGCVSFSCLWPQSTSLHRIFQEKPLKKQLFDHLLSNFFSPPGSDAQVIREAVVLGVCAETNSNVIQFHSFCVLPITSIAGYRTFFVCSGSNS